MDLNNLTVVHARVESYQPAEKFEAIISRAFSEIALFVKLTQHLLVQHGQWLAMKGQLPQEELQGLAVKLNKPINVKKIIPLKVAGLDAERHLLILEKPV